MYVPDTLKRMDEEATLKHLEELVDDDGTPVICDHCDQDATHGLALYNPADALRDPPLDGIYSTLELCDDCYEYVGETAFCCPDCGKWFIINHSWDVVAVMTDDGYKCQKCAAEGLEGVPLYDLLAQIRGGSTDNWTRINSVPGKEEFFSGEFSQYADFPGYTSWAELARAIEKKAYDDGIELNDVVYPIIDHGYQFSVSLAIYH